MSDPTLEELRAFVDALPFAGERSDFDREEAIYWYACAWHGGQTSNLYSALSRSEFYPGPCASPMELTAKMLIDALIEEFSA